MADHEHGARMAWFGLKRRSDLFVKRPNMLERRTRWPGGDPAEKKIHEKLMIIAASHPFVCAAMFR